MCMFLKLKFYFVEIGNLADLTYLAADHIRWDNYHLYRKLTGDVSHFHVS